MPAATKIPRREFLQLADTYDAAKHKIAGFYLSEKLDGKRSFWDGGITRGMQTKDVPWASVTDPKTGSGKGKVKLLSTGLWTRYGNPICAPDSFLNALPACPLDGELWAGRGKFQLTVSITSGDEADSRFDQISYAVYSSPALSHIFATGEIKNANFHLMVNSDEIEKFIQARVKKTGIGLVSIPAGATFEDELLFLRGALETQNDHVFLHQQIKLSNNEEEARAQADEFLAKVLDKGGEGGMFRNPAATWTPKRHKGLLKFKPFKDAEAVVIGFVSGKEGRIGQALGKIGALRVRTVDFENNVEFEIGSGLTLEEREFLNADMSKHAAASPGTDMPTFYQGKHIKKGDTITFKYRELSDDGIPKEGRYWRRRPGVE